MSVADDTNLFMDAFRGRFTGILRWHQLDELWRKVLAGTGNRWYIYTVGEEVPRAAADADTLSVFVRHIDLRLRANHHLAFV